MPVIVVDVLQTVKGDGHTSMQEAFRAAVEKSLVTGLEVTIRFAGAMDINLAKTLVVPDGARIVIDGAIEGDTTIETGSNDVAFHGTTAGSIPPNDAFGHTMIEVAAGGSLRLSDVELADNTVVGADGKSGKSGDNGLNGNSGDEAGLPGSPGNGGLSVSTSGHAGQDAVSGILNMGALVLDRVNMNRLQAYAGDGGSGGSGGNGGHGGNGNEAPGGPGGPGGSGTGHGASGGDAAAGVMNHGTLAMMDTSFQTDFVSSGIGGAGGSGGHGGDGGSGTIGGFGGNGGSAGSGGNGGDAAVTVFNQGTMTLAGGWVYSAGSNLVWGGSGAAGAAGQGGAGGTGGHGSDMGGFDGTGGSNGAAGQAGAGGAAIGWSGATSATTYFVETNRSVVNEYKGDAGQSAELIIYRLGDVSQAGSVTLSISALTAGATGANLQGGLTSGMVVNFAAGQSLGEVFLFARSDHAESGDQDYRFTLTGSTGGVLGGHVATDVTIHDTDVVGDGLANTLQGGKQSEVIWAGAGNDTILASAGDDQIDGESGFDTVDYSAVQRGKHGTGLTGDVLNFSFSGKGVGTDQVSNVDVIIASAFNDRISGGFNAERFQLGSGNDTASGNFGNDTLLGQGGDDRLTGGDLNDSLSGGSGHDLLIGGSGRDTFVFEAAVTAANVDHIADFRAADDTIELVRTGSGPFDALAFGALDPAAFHLGSVATKGAQHVLYDRVTGTLAYDADGKGGAAAEVFAILDTVPKLDAADFFVL